MDIQKLLEKGLYHYGLGEVDKALEIWYEVLRLDPTNQTAAEYIEIETGRKPDLAGWSEARKQKEEPKQRPEPELGEKTPPAAAILPDSFLKGQQLLNLEDWEGALAAFEDAHRSDPANPVLLDYVSLTRARLIKAVLERAGGRFAVPRLRVPLTELAGRKSFSQEEGFVLSLISGDIALEDIISLSPIPRFQTYRIIYNLFQEGLLEVEPGRRR